jgi:hypothetical protein
VTIGTRIEHVIGRPAPARVALVALGPSRTAYHELLAHHEPSAPWEEVWTLNTGMRALRADLCFVMDDEAEFALRYPEYGDLLRAPPCPVITGCVYDEYPAIAYPLAGVTLWTGVGGPYHDCSIPWILAYAGAIGVAEVTLFGVDFDFPDLARRERGREVTAWWCGFLQGRGCQVRIVETSSLLRTRDRMGDPEFRPYYGYMSQSAVDAAIKRAIGR